MVETAQENWSVSSKCGNRLCHIQHGNTSSVESQLSDVLLQHGVPSSAVAARVQRAIQVIGLNPLQVDIDKKDIASNTWRRLKQLASGQSFRWSTRDELSAKKPKSQRCH